MPIKIKLCPNGCFVVLSIRTEKDEYHGWLFCSCCGYREKIKEEKK